MSSANRKSGIAACVVALLAVAGSASAQNLSESRFFGVDETTHKLYRFDFATGEGAHIGPTLTANGHIVRDVTAMAYVPGNLNLYGFFNDPADNLTKLLYINSEDGTAELMNGNFGTGPITGAIACPISPGTALSPDQPTPFNQRVEYGIYAVQTYLTVSGKVNLNPNNSPDMEFLLTRPDGSQITRDDLHSEAKIDSSGTFYFGDAVSVRFKPKGSGTQTSIMLNGAPYYVDNSHAYRLSGEHLTVRVFNDKPRNGKAMGHWWLEIATGSVILEDLGEAGKEAISKQEGKDLFGTILKINPASGVAEQVMMVSRFYDDITAETSQMFYAVSEGKVYAIDPYNKTETYLGTIGSDQVNSLANVGPQPFGYSNVDKRLLPISAATGTVSSTPLNIGDIQVGDFVFAREADAPQSRNND